MSSRINHLCLASIVAASVGACSSEPPPQSAAQTDLTAYRQLLDNVVTATTHYRVVMMDRGMTTSLCGRFHADYDAELRWYFGMMPQLAGEMDTVMMDHQATAPADIECVTAAMVNELDRHARVACSWPDLASDQAEVNRYVDAMLALTTHATERCDGMQSGLDGHGWMWGDTTSSCDR